MLSYIGAIYRHGDKVTFVGEKALLKVQMKRLDMLAETRMFDVPSEASCWLLEDYASKLGHQSTLNRARFAGGFSS